MNNEIQFDIDGKKYFLSEIDHDYVVYDDYTKEYKYQVNDGVLFQYIKTLGLTRLGEFHYHKNNEGAFVWRFDSVDAMEEEHVTYTNKLDEAIIETLGVLHRGKSENPLLKSLMKQIGVSDDLLKSSVCDSIWFERD